MYGAPTPIDVGGELNYYIKVSNTAIGGSTGVFVDFTLPSNVTVTWTYTDRGGGCVGDTKIVTCSLDFISGKGDGNVTIRVKVTGKGDLVASATARSIESDSNPKDNTASSTVTSGAPTKTAASAPPAGLNGNPAGSATSGTADKVKPTASALVNTVHRGSTAALRFKIYDDRGRARATGTVKKGTTVIATLKSGFGPVAAGTVYYLPWKVPSSFSGSYTFCVVATDRAGNKSRPSCAPLSVR
jgi:hypothetical protein